MDKSEKKSACGPRPRQRKPNAGHSPRSNALKIDLRNDTQPWTPFLQEIRDTARNPPTPACRGSSACEVYLFQIQIVAVVVMLMKTVWVTFSPASPVFPLLPFPPSSPLFPTFPPVPLLPSVFPPFPPFSPFLFQVPGPWIVRIL